MRKEREETGDGAAEGDQEVQRGEGVKCCDSRAFYVSEGRFVLLVCRSIKAEDPSVSAPLGGANGVFNGGDMFLEGGELRGILVKLLPLATLQRGRVDF